MNLGDSALLLKFPIYVNIEESDGFIVALSYDLELAEQGDSEFEALDNLRGAIIDLFRLLRKWILMHRRISRASAPFWNRWLSSVVEGRGC